MRKSSPPGCAPSSRVSAGSVVIHCCHRDAPIPLLRSVGASALALDLTAAGPARWESVAASIEAGLGLYAGVLPSEGRAPVEAARRLILDAFERVGLAAENSWRGDHHTRLRAGVFHGGGGTAYPTQRRRPRP